MERRCCGGIQATVEDDGVKEQQRQKSPCAPTVPTPTPREPAECHVLAELFTPAETAVVELRRRWEDSSLNGRILDYLGGDVPDVFRQNPTAVSTAHVATPHFAMREFSAHARRHGLRPVVFEFLDDLFITTNFDKASLAKMRFHVSRNGVDHTWHGRKVTEEFVLGPEHEIDIEDTDFFNHCCDPNTGFKGQIFLVAMRDIRPDEEICFDYAMCLSPVEGMRYEFPCRCGSSACRGRVTSRDWLLPELQAR